MWVQYYGEEKESDGERRFFWEKRGRKWWSFKAGNLYMYGQICKYEKILGKSVNSSSLRGIFEIFPKKNKGNNGLISIATGKFAQKRGHKPGGEHRLRHTLLLLNVPLCSAAICFITHSTRPPNLATRTALLHFLPLRLSSSPAFSYFLYHHETIVRYHQHSKEKHPPHIYQNRRPWVSDSKWRPQIFPSMVLPPHSVSRK